MKKCFVLLLIVMSFFSCDDDLVSNEENRLFDSVGFLSNVLTNHILPEFRTFSSDVVDLIEAKDAFVVDKTIENLLNFRNQYLVAYTSYQSVAKYGLGRSATINFNQNLNTFPFNLVELEAFVLSDQSKELTSVNTQNRQGFPAADFLLNGLADTDEGILAFYTGENGTDYTQYLSTVVDRIDSLSEQASNDWEGTFGNEFSSDSEFFNLYVNTYIQYFESTLRTMKIGFPAGVNTGTISPISIESLYKPEESRGLYLEALASSRLLYTGINEEQSSLSKILINLGEEGLDARIKIAFLEAQSQSNRLNENLRLQVETDNNEMLLTRDALQEVVRLLKVDLTSKLNVSITFQDNDGD